MLGEQVNLQWQALVQFLRGSLWSKRQKPSLMVAIGRRQKANALEEYQRRFAPSAGQEYQLASPQAREERRHAEQPQSFETEQPGSRFETSRSHLRRTRSKAKASLSGGSGHLFSAAWALLNLALLRGYHGVAGGRLVRNGLIAVMAVCAIALGYRTMTAGSDDSNRINNAAPSLDGNTEKAESRPSGKKQIYARLTPDGPVAAPPAAPSTTAGLPNSQSAGADNRADGALPDAKPPGNAPAMSQTSAADKLTVNQRTIVRGETYLPDGTRIDVPRSAPVPSIIRIGPGKVQPPFLAAAKPPESVGRTSSAEPAPLLAAAPVKAEAVPAPEPAKAAEPAPALESGYFAQVKADQDQKAVEAELADIREKYRDALGEVPVKTRSVDLKEKGIWIRVLAGPLKSYDDAAGLCKKLKGAGAEGCFVQKFD
jgi:hypothetical protein